MTTMINRDKKVAIEDALPGMVLSTDVLDARGGMLIAKATVLSEATLTALRRRGIDAVHVLDDAVCVQDQAAELERLQLRLDSLFRKCETNRACTVLRQQILEYRLGSSE
jgi:hypothetical protein